MNQALPYCACSSRCRNRLNGRSNASKNHFAAQDDARFGQSGFSPLKLFYPERLPFEAGCSLNLFEITQTKRGCGSNGEDRQERDRVKPQAGYQSGRVVWTFAGRGGIAIRPRVVKPTVNRGIPRSGCKTGYVPAENSRQVPHPIQTDSENIKSNPDTASGTYSCRNMRGTAPATLNLRLGYARTAQLTGQQDKENVSPMFSGVEVFSFFLVFRSGCSKRIREPQGMLRLFLGGIPLFSALSLSLLIHSLSSQFKFNLKQYRYST